MRFEGRAFAWSRPGRGRSSYAPRIFHGTSSYFRFLARMVNIIVISTNSRDNGHRVFKDGVEGEKMRKWESDCTLTFPSSHFLIVFLLDSGDQNINICLWHKQIECDLAAVNVEFSIFDHATVNLLIEPLRAAKYGLSDDLQAVERIF